MADAQPIDQPIELMEVTCMCGWTCRGTEDEIVAMVQAHGRETHGVASTREEILAIATSVREPVQES